MISRVVLAVNDAAFRERLQKLLTQPDIIVDAVKEQHLLWKHISRESGDLVIMSRGLIPHPEDIAVFRDLPENPLTVVVQEDPTPEDEAALLSGGCDAVLSAGLPDSVIHRAISAILDKRAKVVQSSLANRQLVGAEPRLSDFVSTSRSMHAFMNVVSRVVQSDISLLILGETGVGKEHLARAIHSEGSRSDGPFIAVNCGALPESLLESELFGHERGAFTGATRARRGWFEMAHNGTVFLDEIGELQPHLQVKLLRVLESREIQRVGSERSIKVNVRIMAATNRSLEEEIELGTFRKDLYYRLSVLTLTIPPLRERKEDIPELVDNHLAYCSSHIGKTVVGITPEALNALVNYSWPGNVRELLNVVERGIILSEKEILRQEDLPENVSGLRLSSSLHPPADNSPDPLTLSVNTSLPLKDSRRLIVDQFEKAYLTEILTSSHGRVGEAARKAGIRARSLFDKMKYHGLAKEDFK